MKKNERIIIKCSCGTTVDSRWVGRNGGVIVESGACWKCKARFAYDVGSFRPVKK